MSASVHALKMEAPRAAVARLNLFAVFHLNLAFSSIEEEDRPRVIECCYWPLLSLAAAHGPIAIEATGYTLEEIEKYDPSWIARFHNLIAVGKAELIGSGYAQLIGPLVPAEIVAWNLKLGNETYRRLLGTRPKIALVNEQAYSGGVAAHYLDAGYDALLMDWDNPASHHPEWDAETRYQPQRALCADGRSIGLLWTNTVAFQKLQRFAHGDMSLEEYSSFVANHKNETERTLCIYASDGEIFDFRPGRYRTEEKLEGSEWAKLADIFSTLGTADGMKLMLPSTVLRGAETTNALRLETPAYPVPVKKQRKYNLTRWSVTGRDDIGINAACHRIYGALKRKHADRSEWKRLCHLWASDFRTHITERRWTKFCADLAEEEVRLATRIPTPRSFSGTKIEDRFLTIETPALNARLDRRRGLAIQALSFGSAAPSVGGLPHGYFDDIALQADWYTGDCVFEAPGEAKVTDLEWADTEIVRDDDGTVRVRGVISTPCGPIEKLLTFHATQSRVDFDITFHWDDWGKGSLRLGHFTLLPEAFDTNHLTLTTHNGGFASEAFALAGQTIDHGAPVSFLVSASCGLGMTEGWAEIGDGKNSVRIEMDRSVTPLLGMLTHRQVGNRLFCQFALSMLELDDTRKPGKYASPAHQGQIRRARFSIIRPNSGTTY